MRRRDIYADIAFFCVLFQQKRFSPNLRPDNSCLVYRQRDYRNTHLQNRGALFGDIQFGQHRRRFKAFPRKLNDTCL